MRIAYLDCFSGIAGDMCLGSLVDAGADPDRILSGVASLDLLASVDFVSVTKQGFRGLAVRVEHPEQHSHRTLSDVHAVIQNSSIEESAQRLALRTLGQSRSESSRHDHRSSYVP
jgi:uncharacterized protein (DUF111 family)